jgi:hypothetical protein
MVVFFIITVHYYTQSLLNALERAQLEHLDSITPTEFAALSDDAKTSMFLLCNPMLFPRHLYIDEPAAELPSSVRMMLSLSFFLLLARRPSSLLARRNRIYTFQRSTTLYEERWR